MKVSGFSGVFRKKAQAEKQPDKASMNPYLNARRSWNEHVGAVVASRQSWQITGGAFRIFYTGGSGGPFP